MNGIYILDSKIGKEAKNIDTLISYHEGELKVEKNKDNYFGINPITWAEMEFFGMSIYGLRTEELPLKIEWNSIDHYMYDNINSYWKKWLQQSRNLFHPYYYLTLFSRKENAWCVSGVARQLFSLVENKITSKRKACEYWIEKVPSKYKNILEDTINYRKGLSSRKSWQQKKNTLEFLEYCIKEFNENYKNKYGG